MWFYITMWNFNPQEFSNKLHIIGNLHHCGKYHLGNGELVNLSDFLQPILLRQVSMLYETEAVIIAAGITTAIVFVLTIFAFQVGGIGWDWEGLGRIYIQMITIIFLDQVGLHHDERDPCLCSLCFHHFWIHHDLCPAEQVRSKWWYQKIRARVVAKYL